MSDDADIVKRLSECADQLQDAQYKQMREHITRQAAEIASLRAAINDALTAPWPDPELNSTWHQEPIGPNETPEEAVKRL